MSGARSDKDKGDQLSLFAVSPPAIQRPRHAVQAHLDPEWCALGERLPEGIHLGTSSWSFPGWERLLWQGKPTVEALAQSGLAAYAEHPMFRTVGVDRSYYGPLREDDVASYVAQLQRAQESIEARGGKARPFRVLSKMWEEITTSVFPNHPRYGARAGTPNPHFLDASRFCAEVLPPYLGAFEAFAGPFVFELTPMPRGLMSADALAGQVDRFLERLPRVFRWAFELRNAELLSPRWFEVLAKHGAAHVFNYWTAMPDLRAQLAFPRAIATNFVVARLMLPPYARYQDKKELFAPFDKIVEPQNDMRDDVLLLLQRAKQHGAKDAFIIVNNKAEGSSPLTVKALAERIVREL